MSVIGASHIRKGIDNQDAFMSYQGGAFSNGVKPTVIAVSDGHGGSKYIRSKTGSKLAVKCAVKMAKKMHQSDSYLSSKASKENIEEAVRHVKALFLMEWSKVVDRDYEMYPFSDNELAYLEVNCSGKGYDSVICNHRIAYGCTFLCAFAYEDIVLVLQYGDGDALGLYPEGDVKELIEADPRNIGNETLSLCKIESPLEMQHKILLGEDIPILIMLSTDGIGNSFADKEGLYKIPIDLKDLLVKNGLNLTTIGTILKKELERITEFGSGDDVTIGAILDEVGIIKGSKASPQGS
jgi:hypothetical protein